MRMRSWPAIAEAGADRRAYTALCQAVEQGSMPPAGGCPCVKKRASARILKSGSQSRFLLRLGQNCRRNLRLRKFPARLLDTGRRICYHRDTKHKGENP